MENLLKVLKVLKTRTALTRNGLAELRIRYARQGAKAPFKPEAKKNLTFRHLIIKIEVARSRAGLGSPQKNRIDRNNSNLNDLKSSKRNWRTLKTEEVIKMALIKVKDVKEAIQLMMNILEKLDEIYHALKDAKRSKKPNDK